MAGRFAKLSAGLHRHPKVRRGGRAAREVFIWAICRNADEHGDGRVPADFFAPDYLASELDMPEAEVAAGLERAIEVGLLARDGDDVVLVGWSSAEWGNRATSTERVRRFRERNAGTEGTPPETHETFHPVSRNDETVKLQIRLDQKRVDRERGDNQPVGWSSLPKSKRGVLEKHLPAAQRIWQTQEKLRRAAIPGARSLTPTAERLAAVAERLEAGSPESECEAVLRQYAEEAKRNPSSAQWFNGETNWRPANFTRALGQATGNGTRRTANELLDDQPGEAP